MLQAVVKKNDICKGNKIKKASSVQMTEEAFTQMDKIRLLSSFPVPADAGTGRI
jgi:hypothetical protein